MKPAIKCHYMMWTAIPYLKFTDTQHSCVDPAHRDLIRNRHTRPIEWCLWVGPVENDRRTILVEEYACTDTQAFNPSERNKKCHYLCSAWHLSSLYKSWTCIIEIRVGHNSDVGSTILYFCTRCLSYHVMHGSQTGCLCPRYWLCVISAYFEAWITRPIFIKHK